MAYRKNFHEVEMNSQEMEAALKAHVLVEHKPEQDGPPPRSQNQMVVELVDGQGHQLHPRFIRVRWTV